MLWLHDEVRNSGDVESNKNYNWFFIVSEQNVLRTLFRIGKNPERIDPEFSFFLGVVFETLVTGEITYIETETVTWADH